MLALVVLINVHIISIRQLTERNLSVQKQISPPMSSK